MEGEVLINQENPANQKTYQNKGYRKGNPQGQNYKKNYRNENGANSNYKMKNKEVAQKETVDPYTAQMLIYRAEMYILLRYPYLIDVNNKTEGILNEVNENSQFFVIKSFSEEDVHKAVKYNVWTSTKSGNQTLDSAYKMTEAKGGNVYLFFSCNGSGRFVGLARMKSEVNFDQFFPFWTQDEKWGGLFNIEWLYVKDVPFRHFREIEIMMKDGQMKPVSNSRDTQEIPLEEGKKMIETVQNYSNTNTILEHFEYYDIRQENYEKSSNLKK